mgnify:FL=1
MTTTLKTGVLAAAFAVVGGLASALTIDTFDADQLVGSANGISVAEASSVTGSGILGGVRDMVATSDTVSSTLPNAVGEAAGGLLTFSNDANTTGTLRVVYDGDSDPNVLDTDGLGAFDFTSGLTKDAIALDLVFLDLTDLELHMTVYSSVGGSTQSSSVIKTFDTQAPPGLRKTVPFATFTGTADFTQVSAFEFTLTGPDIDAVDAQIDFIGTVSTVPVPAALPLLLAGFGGLALVKRRQRAG